MMVSVWEGDSEESRGGTESNFQKQYRAVKSSRHKKVQVINYTRQYFPSNYKQKNPTNVEHFCAIQLMISTFFLSLLDRCTLYTVQYTNGLLFFSYLKFMQWSIVVSFCSYNYLKIVSKSFLSDNLLKDMPMQHPLSILFQLPELPPQP